MVEDGPRGIDGAYLYSIIQHNFHSMSYFIPLRVLDCSLQTVINANCLCYICFLHAPLSISTIIVIEVGFKVWNSDAPTRGQSKCVLIAAAVSAAPSVWLRFSR